MIGRFSIAFQCCILCSVLTIQAQDTLLLYPAGQPMPFGPAPHLITQLVPMEKATGSAVMICPGGGYAHLAMDHEGKQIAQWFNSLGIQAFILQYRLGKADGSGYKHPDMLHDAQRGMRMIRAHANEWGVDPKRIAVMGFSAGGHLASTLGTHFDFGAMSSSDPIERMSCRPDLMILCYPVISLNQPWTHVGSRQHLLGPDPDPEVVASLSNESQVTADTPPTFLFHTDADSGVPAENSVYFYLALRKAGVPAEMHIYQPGRHGVGFAPQDAVLSTWKERLRDWLMTQGWMK
ncbi:MAG: alpha/beta hydrolase [Saprospiraceae bacterium]|nr:alpha/beta hydrolase [Saprospiraceae bacterium]